MRGIDHKATEDEHVVALDHKLDLQLYESCLKAFKFKQVLDAVLAVVRNELRLC